MDSHDMEAHFRYAGPDNFMGSKGFSLLEMTFILVIIGMIAGFGLSAWTSMKYSQQISASRTRLRIAAECLSQYVLHSERIPPTSYFQNRCAAKDAWGSELIYENSGDDLEISTVPTRTYRDDTGSSPDAVWILVSPGPDTGRDFTSSSTQWDCSGGDDLCHMTTRNALHYAMRQ